MSSFPQDKEGNETQKNQGSYIPNIEEFLNSPNDNMFLNDSLSRNQKQNISASEDETDEHKNQDSAKNESDNNNDNFNEDHYSSSDDNKDSLEPQKRKKKFHIDPKFDEIVSSPVDLFPSSNSKSYTMTNPDHRYRTFCEIVLVAHHPNYLRKISDFNFIKEIGKGGYGAVWLADDMRTGNQCAVKELYVEELKGRILTNFLREIHSMIIGRGKFICPIIGYTIEPPYSIITKYMPGGDLYHAVHNLDKKNKTRIKPKVYGTHLTIICMCIAHALRHVHRCGIIHRDIKPGNILLDDDGLPYLVDFGVSRLIHPENRHSQFVGTVSHMAPEVISSTNYGTKADVFSYAILLFEVGEKRHAFHNAGKHSKEVCEKILRGERPLFSADAIPTAMKNLITRCWSQNPADRPSFDKIFQIFCEGKTYFKGSNPRKIVKFAQKLIKEDEANLKIPLPPSSNTDVTAVLSRLMRKLTQVGPLDKTLVENQNREKKKKAGTIVEKMIQKPTIFEKIMNSHEAIQIPLKPSDSSDSNLNENIKNIQLQNLSISDSNNSIINQPACEPLPIFINKSEDLEIAKDFKNPKFLNYIQFQLSKISPSQFDDLAQFIIPALASNNTKEILQSLLKTAEQNNDFLLKYSQYHIITSVMLTDENDPYEDELFELLSLVFIKQPALLGQMYTRVLAYFIKKRPKETICLFSSYVENIESIMDPFPILDFLMSYARVYLNIPSGALFIDLFYYLTSEFAEYRVQRFNSLKPIFTAFSRSTEKIVAYEALKAICNLYDDTFQVNIKTLINYIRIGTRASFISNASSIPNLNKFLLSNLNIGSKSFSNLHDKKNCASIEEKLRDVSLSLIERLPFYPLSNMFVQEIAFLVDLFPIKVTNILLKYSHQSVECAQIVARRTDIWMDPTRSNEMCAFNLFLEIFQYPELRNQLAEAPEFPSLMTSMIKRCDKSVMEAIALVFKRIDLTGQIIDELENVGFYNELAQICDQYCKNEQKNHDVTRRSSGLEFYNQSAQKKVDDNQSSDNSILLKSSENKNDNDNENSAISDSNSNNTTCDDEGKDKFLNNINIDNSSHPNLINAKSKKSRMSQKKQKRNSTYGIDDNHNFKHVSHEKISMNIRTVPAAAMFIIEASSKVKYVPSYKLFVPILLIQLPLQNEMTAAAIHTLTVLSFHHELKPVLNKPVLLNYFSQLKQFKAQKKYAITFLFNLLKKT